MTTGDRNSTRFVAAFKCGLEISHSGVELEDLAGDVVECGEVSDEAGGFGGGVETPEGMFLKGGGPDRVGEVCGHAGFEEAREDTIDPHVAGAEFLRETFGESDEAGFARGIGGLSGSGM